MSDHFIVDYVAKVSNGNRASLCTSKDVLKFRALAMFNISMSHLSAEICRLFITLSNSYFDMKVDREAPRYMFAVIVQRFFYTA